MNEIANNKDWMKQVHNDVKELVRKRFEASKKAEEERRKESILKLKEKGAISDKELHSLYYQETHNLATYPTTDPDGNKVNPETKAYKTWKTKINIIVGNEAEEGGFDNLTTKEIEDMVANAIIDKLDVITLKNKDGGSSKIMFVRNGISFYKDITPIIEEMNDWIEKVSKSSYSGLKRNIIMKIQDNTLVDPLTFFTDDPNLIPLQDGIYNAKNNTFLKLENIEDINEFKFFYKLEYNYKDCEKAFNETNKCKFYIDILKEWLTYDVIIEREGIEAKETNWSSECLPTDILEFQGLCFSMNNGMKIEFCFLGSKDTAKTQITNILLAILPDYVISSTSLGRITKDHFGTDDLPFKLVNIVDDMPSHRIYRTGEFKKITGGVERSQAEIKGGGKLMYKPYAKHWFTTNKLGELYDPDDEAFFSRFLINFFNRLYKKKDKNTIKDFYKTITQNKKKMNAIVYACLVGYNSLLERGHFRNELEQNTEHLWNYSADPVYKFLHNNTEKDPDGKDHWYVFKNCFNSETGNCFSSQKLNEAITKHKYEKKNAKIQVGDKKKSVPCICGFKWKDEFINTRNKYVDDNN